MGYILPAFEINDATWFYLSFLLIIAVFFRFGRIWSLRNIDLCLLLSASPGLVLVSQGQQAVGYGWLFTVTGLILLRLFLDGLFTRRPLLDQNLNAPGMLFLGIATLAFLMTKVATEPPPSSTVETIGRADDLLNRRDNSSKHADQALESKEAPPGPASSLLAAPATLTAKVVAGGNGNASENPQEINYVAARILAILAHFAVVIGMVVLGREHFGDWKIGLAMATLYLLLPCTTYDVQKANHVLPSALILWAFVMYRHPMTAGALMGLACGAMFFPVFLLPLWFGFYGRRGVLRFGLALGLVAAVLLTSLVFTSANTHSLTMQIIGSIDWAGLQFQGSQIEGFWNTVHPAYRYPIIACFSVMVVLLTFLPRRKNLEQLISHSTAIVVGTQLWYPQQGGVYLLWYLPLLLAVVFRPRLNHLRPPTVDTTTEAATADAPADAAIRPLEPVKPTNWARPATPSLRMANRPATRAKLPR